MTAFKALNGLLAIDATSIGVQLYTVPTRSHGLGLIVHRAINNTVGGTFSFRMSTKWNSLSMAAKSSSTLRTFKKTCV